MKLNKKELISAAAMVANCLVAQAQITINEVMPANIGTYMDDLFNYAGYAEIKNAGTLAVDLNGYQLQYTSTKKQTTKTFKINYSCSVPAGGQVLFLFDKKEETKMHTNYKMDSDGGTLVLLNGSGKEVAALTHPAMPSYISYGLGKDSVTTGYMEPTPGKKNGVAYDAPTLEKLQLAFQCAAPVFGGTAPGLYTDGGEKSVNLSTKTASSKIYYTTDGTVPTPSNGKVYSEPVSVTKNTVIRARAYADNMLPSAIATGTYLFPDEAHELCGGFTVPIVSIVTDPDNMTGDQVGIAVKGTNGKEGSKSCVKERANYNQSWKRPVNFEFIKDGKVAVSHELEASVMGGCSRQYKIKSLELSASKKCGSGNNKMSYVFFSDKPNNKKYKSLHLRNGGNAYDDLRFRDAFMQALIHNTGLDYQAYLPVAYYLNGKYQGFMDLNERMNADYLYTNYDIDDEELDLISISNATTQDGGVKAAEGTVDAYNDLIIESGNNPASSDYFNRMNRLMDINEYIDYMSFEQFIVNTDWPANNNKMWRKTNNGRFRWMIYDTDFGFGLYPSYGPNYTGYETNMILFCLGEGTAVNWGNGTSNGSTYTFDNNSKWKTALFSNLMKNPEFRSKYLIRNMMLLSSNFDTDRILAVWDSISSQAENEMCASKSPNQYYQYTVEKDAEGIINFAKNRPKQVYNHLASYYGGSVIDLNITSNAPGSQFVINGMRWNSEKYTGKYISNNEIQVKAVPPAGYNFDHWELSSSASGMLLNQASEWRYLYNGEAAGAGWTGSAFDDSAWQTGNGVFGYGSKNVKDDTELDYGDDPENKHITAYFRTEFALDAADQYAKLVATVTYDDAIIVYVNGKEVKRLNIEEGAVDQNTVAITYENDAVANIDIDNSLLKKGTNVIAVELHQDKASSSDMTFALDLEGIGYAKASKSTQQTYTVTLTDDFEMQAVYTKASDNRLPLILNEVCSSNKREGGYADEYDNYGDWIEIYNNSDTDIDIAGLYITDNYLKPKKFQIPGTDPAETTIPARGHKIIWCDNDVWQGPLHTSFKLSATAQTKILLSQDINGKTVSIDSLTYIANLPANSSYGRTEDAAASFVTFKSCETLAAGEKAYETSPGEANGKHLCDAISTDSEIVETDAEHRIHIYPNPVSAYLNVASTAGEIKEIRIFDYAGRLISHLAGAMGQTQSVNTTGLAQGLYIIEVNTTENVSRLKFAKQ